MGRWGKAPIAPSPYVTQVLLCPADLHCFPTASNVHPARLYCILVLPSLLPKAFSVILQITCAVPSPNRKSHSSDSLETFWCSPVLTEELCYLENGRSPVLTVLWKSSFSKLHTCSCENWGRPEVFWRISRRRCTIWEWVVHAIWRMKFCKAPWQWGSWWFPNNVPVLVNLWKDQEVSRPWERGTQFGEGIGSVI